MQNGKTLFSSQSAEWYTPQTVIKRVREVFGGSIDLDPCSNSKTEPNVPARSYYTKQDDGLSKPWTGKVYMNPPYGSEIGKWVAKLLSEYEVGKVTEAIGLVPARTETKWFKPLYTFPICFVSGRLKFSGAKSSAPFPSAIVYLGPNIEAFIAGFTSMGNIC